MRFMMQRADDFHILRRKPIAVCSNFMDFYAHKDMILFSRSMI